MGLSKGCLREDGIFTKMPKITFFDFFEFFVYYLTHADFYYHSHF
jgi:hypothetical protein